MSEKQNRGISDLSKYDAMTTEELEEVLRLDAQDPEEQESDTEMILYIMEVLAERKRNNGHTGKTALEAYESFKQNYMPEIDNENNVPVEESKPNRLNLCWVRGLVAAAAVFVIVILGSITAKAFGVDVWKAVVQWTQETFHFGEWGQSDANSKLPYASLQEALEKGDTPTWLVPTWFPDGFELVEITTQQSPLHKKYRAIYMQGDKQLRITVQDYSDKVPVFMEQSEGEAEEYQVLGITYYLFSNYDNVKAVWIAGSCECYISGNVTIDELKKIIDSIEKG